MVLGLELETTKGDWIKLFHSLLEGHRGASAIKTCGSVSEYTNSLIKLVDDPASATICRKAALEDWVSDWIIADSTSIWAALVHIDLIKGINPKTGRDKLLAFVTLSEAKYVSLGFDSFNILSDNVLLLAFEALRERFEYRNAEDDNWKSYEKLLWQYAKTFRLDEITAHCMARLACVGHLKVVKMTTSDRDEHVDHEMVSGYEHHLMKESWPGEASQDWRSDFVKHVLADPARRTSVQLVHKTRSWTKLSYFLSEGYENQLDDNLPNVIEALDESRGSMAILFEAIDGSSK